MDGDFNEHVGRMSAEYKSPWGMALWEQKSGGTIVAAAAPTYDLAIVNSFLQKKDQPFTFFLNLIYLYFILFTFIYLITYRSVNHSTQIDFFLRSRGEISTVKLYKGSH